MLEKHGHFIEDLSVGMTDIFSKTVTEADVTLFAGLSGDTNPLHLDADFASKTMFAGRITHGMLTAAFISTVLGTRLPGPGCVYLSQNLRFKGPVRVGDTVEARVSVKEIIEEKKRVVFDTTCSVGGKVVLDGEATLMVSRRADMIAPIQAAE